MVESTLTTAKTTTTAPPVEPRKLVKIELTEEGRFKVLFSVRKGEIPVTRREFDLILRALRVQYGEYTRHILLQERLKQKPQGVSNAVA